MTQELAQVVHLSRVAMYRLKRDIAISQQDENTLVIISVLDTENCYFKLTGIGKEVFLHLKEGEKIEEIQKKIVDQYDVDITTVEQDIKNLITYLVENNIIENV